MCPAVVCVYVSESSGCVGRAQVVSVCADSCSVCVVCVRVYVCAVGCVQNLYSVMEYADGGDLVSYISSYPTAEMPEDDARYFFRQFLLGASHACLCVSVCHVCLYVFMCVCVCVMRARACVLACSLEAVCQCSHSNVLLCLVWIRRIRRYSPHRLLLPGPVTRKRGDHHGMRLLLCTRTHASTRMCRCRSHVC